MFVDIFTKLNRVVPPGNQFMKRKFYLKCVQISIAVKNSVVCIIAKPVPCDFFVRSKSYTFLKSFVSWNKVNILSNFINQNKIDRKSEKS